MIVSLVISAYEINVFLDVTLMKIAVEASHVLITDARIHANKIHAVQMQFAR